MILTVEHITTYRYDRPVRGVVQSHRLQPSQFDGQRVQSWDVTVTDGRQGGGDGFRRAVHRNPEGRACGMTRDN